MSQPNDPNVLGAGRMDRRLFLKLAAFLSVAASGCASDGTPLIDGATSGGGASNPPVAVTGRVNLQDFGGGPLFIQTVNRQNVPVNPDGSFSTMVGGNNQPQLVFLTGNPPTNRSQLNAELSSFFPGPLKAIGLYLPGASEAFVLSINATATALVFLTYGILTVNLSEATERVRRIIGLSNYAPLVAGLSNFLGAGSLAEAGLSPDFQALKQACIDEYFTAPSGKLTPEEYTALIPQGLVTSQKGGVNNQGQQTISFENHGFRWVTAIRQELDAQGNSSQPPKRIPLIGSNVGGVFTVPHDTDGLLGGGNTFGWGNLFTGQNEDPGSGVDLFVPAEATTRVRYWMLGPGSGEVTLRLPSDITPQDFGHRALIMTCFYYFYLPLFDIVSGGLAGLAIHRLGPRFYQDPDVLRAYEQLLETLGSNNGVLTAGDSLVGSYRTGQEGNITSGWIDLLAALSSFSVGVGQQVYLGLVAEAEAAAAAAAAEGFFDLGLLALSTEVAGVALAAMAAVFAVSGLAFAGLNLSRAIRDHQRLPALVQITQILRAAPYDLVVCPLKPQVYDIATDALSDLNEAIVYIVGTTNETTGAYIWRPLLGGVLDPDRELVGPLPDCLINWEHRAFLNKNSYLVYLAYSNERVVYYTMLRRGLAGEFVQLDDARVRDNRFYPLPLGLNNENVMVGIRVPYNDFMRGQLFTYDLSPGGSLTLIDLAAKLGVPTANVRSAQINDLGQIVGTVSNEVELSLGIFVYLPDDTAAIIVTPQQTNGQLPSINNRGEVLYIDRDNRLRVVDLRGDLIRELAMPQGFHTPSIVQGALNDNGQVVASLAGGQSAGDFVSATALFEEDGSSLLISDFAASFTDSNGLQVPRFSGLRINNLGVVQGVYAPDTDRGRSLTSALMVPRTNTKKL